MSRVNPPPHVKTPKEFFEKKETRSYFQQIEFMLFQLWKRTGGGEDSVESGNNFNTTNQAAINEINQRLGSGDPFTWDETGFSWDSTKITFDRTES